MTTRFHDRAHAGRELAEHLRILQEKGLLPHPVVLALPRGGVTVAEQVARALGADLDVLVVRKIGAPFHEEFGVGALAGDEPPLFDRRSLDQTGLTEDDLAPVVERERAELRRREERYRQGRPAPELEGRTVILVDDGLATGATARAAVHAVRGRQPERIVVAVPVASHEAVELLRHEADDVVCLLRPSPFHAVGLWYENFDQLTDDDVLKALHTGLGGTAMTRYVRDVMSPGATAVEPMTTLSEAARVMREQNIGDVLVAYDCDLFGVLTDRDITVRAVAEGRDPRVTTVGSLCTRPPVITLDPDDTTDHAVELMRRHALRRLPVVEHGGCPVGMVSLGDLATTEDPHSALADISRADPNR
jgi:predicted phosphoribosyltransferase